MTELMFESSTACSHAREVASALEGQAGGTVVPRVSWAGARFNALVELHGQEIARRKAAGLGAVTAFSAVRALCSLPEGMEVPWRALDPVVAAYLGGLDEGAVSVTPDGVTRLLRPPLKILTLFTLASNWQVLGRVGILASDAPVTVLLRHRPRDEHVAGACAERHGLGLSYWSKSTIKQLRAPNPKVVPSLRRTRLEEVVFGQWLRMSNGADPSEAKPSLELL